MKKSEKGTFFPLHISTSMEKMEKNTIKIWFLQIWKSETFSIKTFPTQIFRVIGVQCPVTQT